jgi:hypothetical protein
MFFPLEGTPPDIPIAFSFIGLLIDGPPPEGIFILDEAGRFGVLFIFYFLIIKDFSFLYFYSTNVIKFNQMNLYPNDYLKYWRVIRRYMKVKHNIGQAELEIILFLYSEGKFPASRFNEFNETINWEPDRLSRMINEGWVERFRRRDGKMAGLYCITDKSRLIVLDIYRKLNGEEIPMTADNNPLFMKKVPYTHKVYKNMVISMNQFLRKKIKEKTQLDKAKALEKAIAKEAEGES